jgi:transposase InsO family protein
MMDAVDYLEDAVGVARACAVMGVNRARVYRVRERRRHLSGAQVPRRPRPGPPLALTAEERAAVLQALNSNRFADMAPASIYATLLDEDRYLCSVRTMYRLLAADGAVRERRNQLTHPVYTKPELLATGPCQVWSWDITKLRGPVKWSYFHLYVILDIFSRYVVGWMIALRETAELAEQLIADTVAKQAIEPGTLTLHADRGTSMRSKPVAQLLVDLDVAKTHSRPHVSDDNPFSEAQFRTLKYRPDFPERFGCIEDARTHCQRFFDWYNTQHRHSGIGMMTPATVHYHRAAAVCKQRTSTLDAAFARNPKRFKGVAPQPPSAPTAVWINPPAKEPASPTTPTHSTVISINAVSQSH